MICSTPGGRPGPVSLTVIRAILPNWMPRMVIWRLGSLPSTTYFTAFRTRLEMTLVSAPRGASDLDRSRQLDSQLSTELMSEPRQLPAPSRWCLPNFQLAVCCEAFK